MTSRLHIPISETRTYCGLPIDGSIAMRGEETAPPICFICARQQYAERKKIWSRQIAAHA